MTRPEDNIQEEYDFSGGARGKFHFPKTSLVPPVHLDPDVLSFLQDRANTRGMALSVLVNLLLKKDIELIESAG